MNTHKFTRGDYVRICGYGLCRFSHAKGGYMVCVQVTGPRTVVIVSAIHVTPHAK